MNKQLLIEELKALQAQVMTINSRIDEIVELIEEDEKEEAMEPTINIDPNEDFGGWFEQLLAQMKVNAEKLEIDDDEAVEDEREEIPVPSIRSTKNPVFKPVVKAVNSPITVNFTNCFNEANSNDFAAAMLPRRVIVTPKLKDTGKTAINRGQKERIEFNKFVRSKMKKR